MHSPKEEQIRITIYETTLTVQQNTLSVRTAIVMQNLVLNSFKKVFHVIIQTPEQKVSLVRYPFDFVEFHQKVYKQLKVQARF